MAGSVYALMDAMHTLGLRKPSHRAPREPEPQQLAPRNHAVLPFCQGGKLGVRAHFFPHSGNK